MKGPIWLVFHECKRVAVDFFARSTVRDGSKSDQTSSEAYRVLGLRFIVLVLRSVLIVMALA